MIYPIEEFARFKDECAILEDLNSYLTDIISSIEDEISSSVTKHFGQTENWRNRKNPNFMSKFSSKDRIFLDINQNLNKITNLNWKTISDVLTTLINTHLSSIADDGERESAINTILSTLVTNILEKSIAQDIFCEFYIKCLHGIEIVSMKPMIAARMASLIGQFYELIDKDDSECDNELTRLVGLNINQYRNIGHFFGSLYNESIMANSEMLRVLPRFIRHISDSLEWEPINKTLVELKINLLVGFLTPTLKSIWTTVDKDTQQDLECQLNILTNQFNLPQRLKYHLLDINDKILDVKKAKARSSTVNPKISYAATANNSHHNSHHNTHHGHRRRDGGKR